MGRPIVSLRRAVSKLGFASRTIAERLILAGRVSVNGRAALNPAARVDPGRDRVSVDGRYLARAETVVVALHKPAGYVTTRSDERGRPTVYDLVPADAPWLGPVGRLDMATEGLLLLTNDTRLADAICDPARGVTKTYLVLVHPRPGKDVAAALRSGVPLPDGPARAVSARVVEHAMREPGPWLELVIAEGRNRIVRRMCEALGLRVKRLIRTRIGPLRLGGIPRGGSRNLGPREVSDLRRAAGRR
jgi:23S rRNA pseudouridine2605 synthase